MNRHFLIWTLLMGLLWLVSGCTAQEGGENTAVSPATTETTASDTLHIVTTTTQASDLTRILTAGSPNIEITPLMGAGVDPHLYQPTEADIAAMNRAQMIVYNGLHLEGQFDNVFEALREQNVQIYALAQPVKEAGFIIGSVEEEADAPSADDPHFWFDPRNWEITTRDLAEQLAQLDPANADLYRANAEAYVSQLTQLHAWAEEGMLSVPTSQRYIVTSHDAFQYFGAAFGWRMAAIQGISTEAEAGVGDIQGTVDFVLANDIPVLFVESSVAPNSITAVREAISSAGGDARLGVRELYSDAMDAPDTFGGTYIGMIASNVYTILQSYQCAGVDLTIPTWPTDLLPTPDEALLAPSC